MSKSSDIENGNHIDSTSKGDSLIIIGLKYGAKAGFWLSIIYALTGMIVVILVEGGMGFVKVIMIFVFAFIGIFFLAVAPATLYGLFTGIILGAFIERFNKRIPKYVCVILSMMICLGIAEISHFILGIHPALSFKSMVSPSGDSLDFPPFDSYLFWVGFPTIIYIITGGWAGWKLYSKMLEKNG